MLARFAAALALAGCTSAVTPLSTPAPKAPVAPGAPEADRPVLSRPHRVARLSPPFFASGSIRHVTASEAGTALVSADDGAAR
jgi:hypothetical protein